MAGRVEETVEALQEDQAFRHGAIGVCMLRLDDGTEVAAARADRVLLPASTMKAVTTAAALDLLGPDYHFVTEVGVTTPPDEAGVVDGDLVIKGGGDPTLGANGATEIYWKWLTALREAGIRQINGRVIGDDSFFDTRLVGNLWSWVDLGNYYGAGSSGLSISQNDYRITFAPGTSGQPARFIGASPAPPGVTFISEMMTGPSGSGDRGYAYSAPYSTTVYLRGTIPAGPKQFSIRGALPDPALYVADSFRNFLEEQGLEVGGEATTARLLTAEGKAVPAFASVVSTIRSAPLSTLILDTNLWSRNLNAEAIMKACGAAGEGAGSPDAGTGAIRSHWAAQGVDFQGAVLADGSGMSAGNRLSARQLAQILRAASKGPHAEAFLKSLPVAGRSGTMRSIGGSTPAAGRFAAKTGTMLRTKCVAGYLTALDGTRYVLVILINDYEGAHAVAVRAIERILTAAVRLSGATVISPAP